MTHIRRALRLTLGVAVGFFALTAAVPFSKAKVLEKKCNVTEVLTVGGPDADEPAQFYEKIGTVVIDADAKGNVYVLDSGNCRVQVFGSDGQFVRSIGQEGGGPGEFKLPRHLDVNQAGMVAVYDMGQSRVSIFDAGGRLARDQVTGGMVEGLSLGEDGSLFLMYEPSGGVELEAFDSSGNSAWKIGQPIEETDGMVMKFGMSVMAPKVAVDGNGAVYRMAEGEYKVLLAKNGKEAGVWSRPFDRVAFEMPKRNKKDDEEGGPKMMFITVEEEAGPKGSERNVSVGDKGGEHEMSFDMDDLKKYMPEFTNDVRGIMVWPDGRVWVPTAETDGDYNVVDEWSPNGEHTRKLSLPDKYDWLRVGSDGHLYGVTHDEDDYPIVCRLEVQVQ